MSRELIFAKLSMLTSPLIAIEALWDGDTTGWFICLNAITKDGQSHQLDVLSDGGDIRLFNGHVPPWPEAVAAKQLGNELAGRFGVEFYFPSPDHPEDNCPGWMERNKGYPCQRCGILLLQRPGCPWRGFCYHCHLEEEHELREAKWTPEQRAGPKCHICGNPATKELNGQLACADCFDKYEFYACEKCGNVTTIHKSISHSSLCSQCRIQLSIDSLTPAQKNTIRVAVAKGYFKGIQTVMAVMGCLLSDAVRVMHVLDGRNKR